MLEKTRLLAFDLLWETLKESPRGVELTMEDLAERCEEIEMDDWGDYQISSRKLLDDPVDLDELRPELLDHADAFGFVVEDSKERFVLWDRRDPGRPIRVRDIANLELDTFTMMAIGVDIDVTIRCGAITFKRPLEPAFGRRIDDALAEELDCIFGECGVSSWKPLWLPDQPVMDGTMWRLLITFKDRTAIACNGDNAFPDSFDDLVDGIATVVEGWTQLDMRSAVRYREEKARAPFWRAGLQESKRE